MDKKILVGLLIIVVFISAAAILLPGGRTIETNPRLPWLIEPTTDGSIRVFDLTLGESDLNEARQVFQHDPKISLFRSANGQFSVEAYFDRIILSGLKANVVMKLDIDQQTAAAMYERGARISQTGGGEKRVELKEDDYTQAMDAAITSITYLPTANLDPELVAERFGEPAEKLAEDEFITHWLYPDKGLDIALNAEGKEVFQYLMPSQFDAVTAPLKATSGPSTAE